MTPSSGSEEPSLISSAASDSEELPSKLDLRDRGLVSRAKDQTPYGSCWAFGGLAASEISLKNSLGNAKAGEVNEINFSARHTGWFGWTPLSSDVNELTGTAKTQVGEGPFDSEGDKYPGTSRRMSLGGSSELVASLLMQGVGPVSLDEVPYRSNDGQRYGDDWSVSDSLRYHSLARLSKENYIATRLDGNENTIISMKKELNSGKGIAIGYNSSVSYLNTKTYAQYNSKDLQPNHMVCIVGYDDDYDVSNFNSSMRPAKNGAFLVKNSWSGTYGNTPGNGDYSMQYGDTWGVDGTGFFWLSYYDVSITDIVSFEFDMSTYTGSNIDSSKEIIDQYDYLQVGVMDRLTTLMQNDEKDYYAAIYTASESQAIHSVGTYYLTPGNTLKYKVYKLRDDAKTPDDYDGESALLASGSYVSDYQGYVKIELDKVVKLNKGEKYTVMFRQIEADKGYRVAPFSRGNIVSSKAIVNDGQSFLQNDTSWEDWAGRKRGAEAYYTSWQIDDFCVKAYATVIDSADTTHSVYFNYNNGKDKTYTLVNEGEYLSAPENVEKTGYTLAGWYKDPELTEPFDLENETVTSDLELYAKWTPNVYTINFDGNGADAGQRMTSQNVTYDQSTNLFNNTFTLSGSKFVGWSTTPSGISGQTFSEGQEVFNLIDKGSITLYAKWDNVFNVDYIMNGHGEQVETQVVSSGGKASIPTAPSEVGYTFVNWYSDENLTEVFDFSKAIEQNCCAYAKWTANTYEIEYELYGGTNAQENLDYYTYDVGVNRFEDPKKRGSLFRGWYTDPQFENKIESIPSDSTEKYKLYAKWSEQCCTIDFNANGASGEMEYQNFDLENGDSISPLKYTCSKHLFLGWNTEQDGTGKSYENNQKDVDFSVGESVVLYAQ